VFIDDVAETALGRVEVARPLPRLVTADLADPGGEDPADGDDQRELPGSWHGPDPADAGGDGHADGSDHVGEQAALGLDEAEPGCLNKP
jgi:hypothetical protein